MIHEIGELLAHPLTHRMVAERVADGARRALQARAAAVLVPAPGGELGVEGTAGDAAALTADRDVVRRAASERRPVVSAGAAAEPPPPTAGESRAERVEPTPATLLAVPMIAGGEVLGVLAIAAARDDGFGGADLAQATTVAELGAIAMALARLQGEALRHRREAEALARAEDALRASEAVKAAIVETSLDAVITMDHGGRIVEFNAAAERIFGHSRENALGQELASLIIPPALRERHRRGLERHLATGESRVLNQRVELTALRVDGTEFPIELAVTRIPVDGPPLFTGHIRDLTEQRRLEAQFLQAQKMEAVGRLAGGVAHDFNNLLTVIMGRAYVLLARLGKDHPLWHQIDLIRTTAERAAGLTQQLLAFSRKQVLQPRILDVNTVLGAMDGMLRRTIGEDIELRVVGAPGIGRVRADPIQLEQVLLNLVVNARDAMPGGGRLTIETANVDLDAAFVATHPGARAGPCVLIAVTDTGHGMAPETMAHVFEPFFTTKEPGKGTGLGLATVYGIVKQHDGYIGVDSAPGQGARFTVYLPRLPGDVTEGEAPRPQRPARGSETVLLVEDEAGLRDLVHEILRAHGYAVLEATNPGEALLVSERDPGRIDLLLTDVVMPLMSGPALAERLRRLRPDLRVLFMSGYTRDALATRDAPPPGTRLLQKPFSPAALAHAVREALDAPP
jgi:two-component system cell cycle sensor histidine kinase/response regulator CckA